jgi:hypothetical protein
LFSAAVTAQGNLTFRKQGRSLTAWMKQGLRNVDKHNIQNLKLHANGFTIVFSRVFSFHRLQVDRSFPSLVLSQYIRVSAAFFASDFAIVTQEMFEYWESRKNQSRYGVLIIISRYYVILYLCLESKAGIDLQ